MVFTIRKRYVQIGAVVVLSFVLILMSLSKHAHRIAETPNFIDSLSFSLFAGREPTIIDTHSEFNQKVTRILEQKQEQDPEDTFWAIDTEITPDQTLLAVPEYFLWPASQRPVAQPFDPRFTLGIYYSYIARHPDTLVNRQVPFHWEDWVDMTPLNKYLFSGDKSDFTCAEFDARPYQESHWPNSDLHLQRGAFDPETFCRLDTETGENPLGFVIDRYFGRTTPEQSIILGKANLYSSAPNPYSITFLTKDGSYMVEVAREKSKMLENGMVSEYLQENNDKLELNTLHEFRQLQAKIEPVVDEVLHDYEVHLKHEDFIYEPTKVMKEVEQGQQSGVSSYQKTNYLESVAYSMAEHLSPPKYFMEARIFDTIVGDHYDWRFFGGLKADSQEQSNSLHRLVRSWLSFTRKQGITTWMAHGSLLSWYWNGVGFPWDNDIDVQVPVMSLHKLSLKFNQSLIVEDSEDGFGRYFLDCGSFINTRNHNNGNNNIDARFIDIDSGLYIDITGLAVSSDPSPSRYEDSLPSGYNKEEHSFYEMNDLLKVYNCRNNHFSSLTELSPLVKTFVEGEVAYIPKRYSDILTYEYDGHGLLQNFFAGHLYLPKLRLWVHQDTLRFFIRHREQWKAYYSKPLNSHEVLSVPVTSGNLNNDEVKILLGLSEEDFLDLLLADDLLVHFVQSRELTSAHETEVMRLLFGKTTQDIVESAPDFKPLMYEPFLYRLNRDYSTFESRLEIYRNLQQKMEKQLAKQAVDAKNKALSSGSVNKGSTDGSASVENIDEKQEHESEQNDKLVKPEDKPAEESSEESLKESSKESSEKESSEKEFSDNESSDDKTPGENTVEEKPVENKPVENRPVEEQLADAEKDAFL